MIVQFGTSRFLQAHVDLFVHEARAAGQDVPQITVIQTSGAPERAARVKAFDNPDGYPVIIRGLENGQPVDREIRVTSVAQGLSVARDWPRIVQLFAQDARFVVSNTGDAGYALDPADAGQGLDAGRPLRSFPAKLAQLLHARYLAGGAPITILPCELLNGNGPILRGLVQGLSQDAAPGFLDWLAAKVVFANTLVDRIVSEPIDPVGAVAEPYALWAIEDAPGLTLPCRHPAIKVAASIEPYERLKLHILNLGHTVLAEIWASDSRPADETVRQILADAPIRARLEALYAAEVIPGFAAHGMQDDARAYVDTTMARFLNPYLDHRIADIAGNHALKVQRRLAAFVDWAKAAGSVTPMPVLTAIIERNAA